MSSAARLLLTSPWRGVRLKTTWHNEHSHNISRSGAASNSVITHQPERRCHTPRLPLAHSLTWSNSTCHEKNHGVAAVPCYSTTSCYSGKQRLDQWTSSYQMDLLLLAQCARSPTPPPPCHFGGPLSGQWAPRGEHLLNGELLFKLPGNGDTSAALWLTHLVFHAFLCSVKIQTTPRPKAFTHICRSKNQIRV